MNWWIPKAAAAVALTLFMVSCSEQGEKAESKTPLHVVVRQARLASITPMTNLSGLVQAKNLVPVAFRVAGIVEKRNVKLGQKVAADDVLAEIDPSEQQQDIAAAQASVDSAEADLKLAKSDYDRQKQLFDKGVITRAAFETAAQKLKVDGAALEQARSNLELAQRNLSYTELTAGVAGIVTDVEAEAGQYVQSGQTVFTIAAEDGLQAVFDVPVSVLDNADTRNRALQVSLIANPGITVKAKFAEMSPVVDSQTGTVTVKVDLIDPPKEIKLGSAVAVDAPSRPFDGFVFPLSSLNAFNGKPALWVVDASTHEANLRQVELAAFNDESIEVISGVTDGEMVVVEGGQLLSPGQVVNPGDES